VCPTRTGLNTGTDEGTLTDAPTSSWASIDRSSLGRKRIGDRHAHIRGFVVNSPWRAVDDGMLRAGVALKDGFVPGRLLGDRTGDSRHPTVCQPVAGDSLGGVSLGDKPSASSGGPSARLSSEARGV
jgi:hypothetical protein